MTHSKQTYCMLVAAVTVLVLSISPAQAKKPDNPGGGGGGGGGAGNNGGGVIYYGYHGEVFTMNDDGSEVAVVSGFPEGFSGWGEPSYQLHGESKRWFLQEHEVPGEFYPDFDSNGTIKDFANRRVFYAVSDGGNAVQLSIPPDLEPLGGKWTVDDGYVSFPGRLWDINPLSSTFASVLEGGLYRTQINFEATTGDVTGAGASELVFPLPLVPSNAYRQSNESTPGPDMYRFDWAPDGKQFVFEAVASEALLIGNIDNADSGELDLLFSDPERSVSNPRWSPAGDAIMFNHFTGWNEVDSISPDGSGLKKLVGSSPTWSMSAGVWSPTGSHLLFQHFDRFLSDSHIVRAKANGSKRTRLTGEDIGDFSGPRAIGWRNVPTVAAAEFASVPEPSSLVFGVLAGVGLVWRRR